MGEKIVITDTKEAESLLHQNSSPEALNELASKVDAEALKLLVNAAIALSWDEKNSAFSTFAITYKK
jgi:hypothetical protein